MGTCSDHSQFGVVRDERSPPQCREFQRVFADQFRLDRLARSWTLARDWRGPTRFTHRQAPQGLVATLGPCRGRVGQATGRDAQQGRARIKHPRCIVS